MGEIDLLNSEELYAGETCNAAVIVTYPSCISEYFKLENVWEITVASRHVGYFKINEIQKL